MLVHTAICRQFTWPVCLNVKSREETSELPSQVVSATALEKLAVFFHRISTPLVSAGER
jgi:heme A synthase